MKDFFSRLTWVDYVALVAVLRGCYVGYKSGFFPEILRIVSYLASVIVAVRFFAPVSQFLTVKTFLNDATASVVSFGALFIVMLILTKLFSMLLLKLLKVGQGGLFLKLFGTLLGACRWVLILSLVFMLVGRLPATQLQKDITTRSVTGEAISTLAPTFFDFLASLSPQLALPEEERQGPAKGGSASGGK